MSNTDFFRCKVYEPVFKSLKESYESAYIGESHNVKEYVYSGGSASGKSMNVINNMIFWLPETPGDRALIIIYSNLHKIQSKLLIVSILKKHGYLPAVKNISTGDININFGNDNGFDLRSVETGSIEQLSEKFKTGDGETKPYKFLWFEEFTAILNSFRSLENFYNAKSKLFRLLNNNNHVFYTYNPPANKSHIVYDWLGNFQGLKLHTTIYDLPKKWQDKNTITDAEELKRRNITSFRHIYMGEQVSSEGLAFDINGDIFINEINENEYIDFFYQTDEGNKNATVFILFGLTNKHHVHLLKTFYHSSKIDGNNYSLSDYANHFDKFYEKNGVNTENVATDSLFFAAELRNHGYNKCFSIGKKKNRPLSYRLLSEFILNKKFKIYNDESNIVAFEQLLNAKKEYNRLGEAMVSKKGESFENQKYHTHTVDTCLYLFLRLQNRIFKKGGE